MKERVTITVDKKVLALADSLVGKDNIKNRSHAIESIIFSHFSGAGGIKAVLVAGRKPSQESVRQTLDNLEKAGVNEIIVAGGRNNEALFSVVSSHPKYASKSVFLKEDKELGTAGIIKSAEAMLNGTFIVVYADISYSLEFKDMLDAHSASKKRATMAVTMPRSKADLVDSIRVSGNTVTSFTYMAKEPTRLQNAGIFVFGEGSLDIFPTTGSLEKDVLPQLAQGGSLGLFLFDSAWKHKG
ncbi:MAG: NDP-sugar synthase [Candidatus Diapherotrites archaeon]|uniref:NDP-sugar synthase n=1 Tax=Candidatus Iainarchaeum sp. TaxID=3101447 RepID=A0A8T3YJK4_9ARCH|nr:NDP-sugar synthase [Candidatus Diapherotrites archaeon]